MSSGAQPAILLFPSGNQVDIYSTKIDAGTVVSGESHVVPSSPPYQFFLNYKPQQNNPTTTLISGFAEVSGTPSTFQFQTNYSGVNAGLIVFNALQAGASTPVTYTAFGDTVEAGFVNDPQTSIQNIEKYLLATASSGSFIPTSGGAFTGTLIANGNLELAIGNITAQTSGNNSIGSAAVPLNNIFSNNITTYNLKSFSPLNILATGGDLTLSGNSVHVQSSTGVIDFQGNILPEISGSYNIGSSSSLWATAFINNLGSNITLISGSNILTQVSGVGNIGSTFLPLGTIYANNLGSNITLISGSNILTQVSGVGNIGSTFLPLGTIYANNIISPSLSANLSGVFVSISGDTIVGPVTINSIFNAGFNNVNSGTYSSTLGLQNIINGGTGPVAIGIENVINGNGSVGIGLTNIVSGNFSMALGNSNHILSNNCIAGGYLTSIDNMSNNSFAFGNGTIVSSGAIGALGYGRAVHANSMCFSDSLSASTNDISQLMLQFLNGVVLNSGTDLLTSISGGSDVGSLSNPFDNIYANNIQLNSIIIIPSTPPTSGTAAGTTGQIIMGTDGYFYGCSGTNLWGRIQLNSF